MTIINLWAGSDARSDTRGRFLIGDDDTEQPVYRIGPNPREGAFRRDAEDMASGTRNGHWAEFYPADDNNVLGPLVATFDSDSGTITPQPGMSDAAARYVGVSPQ